MTIGEVKKKLKKAGCYLEEQRKRHEWWWSPITNINFPVPRHDNKQIPAGTKKSIETMSGIKL